MACERLPLDTSVALLAVFQSVALSTQVREAIERGPNYLSVISYWEVLLKSMKGKLYVGDPQAWWQDTLAQLGATPLPLRADHVAVIYHLPPVHQDPFDRALVAQATVEGLTLLTTDSVLPRHANERLRVMQ